MSSPAPTDGGLRERIADTLARDPDRPWCVHGLYEALLASAGDHRRDELLLETQNAAEELVDEGRARREYVSAIGIGVHCEDSVYWTPNAGKDSLADFGPDYESPAILYRLASHIRCHGL
jgi:hypothetical protein